MTQTLKENLISTYDWCVRSEISPQNSQISMDSDSASGFSFASQVSSTFSASSTHSSKFKEQAAKELR